MRRENKTHLRGERGQTFADKIRGLNPEQILCVSLDISKYFHLVMIHNGLGEIVMPTFEIDIFQTGFTKLCHAIDEAIAQTQADLVLVGMEPTSHYFENLARHLKERPQPVTLINSYAVSQNRKQQMMRREKTDPIDVAAIGDLLRRGEGSTFQPVQGLYLQLQHLDRVRLGKVKMRTMLKNQIIGHLDRIFPGLVIIGSEARKRYTPLFTADFWNCRTLQHLIRVCPDPRQVAAMSTDDLITAFHAHNYPLGPKTAAKIITYAQKVLLPDEEVIAIRCELLHHDLILLDAVEQRIAVMEERLVDLVAQTPYLIWTKLKGFSDIQVAHLAAAIGDPAHYTHAKKVFRRSGLVSGRNDSGVQQNRGKGNRVLKTGDVYLRRALLGAISTLLLHQPILFRYYTKLKLSKPDPVARVATARRANGMLWAALRDQHSTALVYKRGAQM
jgi:transposase